MNKRYEDQAIALAGVFQAAAQVEQLAKTGYSPSDYLQTNMSSLFDLNPDSVRAVFGNDLRTNQEAVRQFDKIIPGEYKLYVQFKDSNRNKTSVKVSGLIYTKAEDGQERGEAFTRTLRIGDSRSHIGTVILKADGSYVFKKP